MQFPTPVVTEITAPNNVPFAPGNNVAGFGSDIPPELTAAGYVNAIVFYSSTWNPSATVPTIKFRFIATNQTTGDLILGYGICTNPSVSQTAVVTAGLDLNLQGIVAPGGAQFAPGNNVVGLGSQLPPEMVTAGYVDALVFYSTTWNPAATTFTVKFRFITVAGNNLVCGFGYCTNPSVSQVANIVEALVVTLNTGFNDVAINANHVSGRSMFNVQGVTGDVQLHLSSDSSLTLGGVDLSTSGDSGFLLLGDNGTNQGWLGAGNVYLQGGVGANPICRILAQATFDATATLVRDTGWFSIPLAGNWVSDPSWPASYRLMPDGTVLFKGHITEVTNPANGETWMSGLPAAYIPLQPVEFLVPCGTRAYNNSANGQAVRFFTDGTAVIYDAATTLTGDIVLDTVRYPVI